MHNSTEGKRCLENCKNERSQLTVEGQLSELKRMGAGGTYNRLLIEKPSRGANAVGA